MTKIEKTLIKKDLSEVINNERIFLPIIALPVIMTVLLPLLLVLCANYIMSDEIIINQLQLLLKSLPHEYLAYSSGQLIIKIMTDYMFPSYFLIIPITTASVIGASSFVGEKEKNTMETLLYTPISIAQLFRAKILGVFITAYGITLCAFLSFWIIINIGGLMYFRGFVLPDTKWLFIIFWISPAISALSMIITVLVSAASKSYREAQQISGLLDLPVIFGLVGQMSGVATPNSFILFVVGAGILMIDYLLIKKASTKFITEKLI